MAEAVPRVSVLLPVRDAEASLPASLDSLRRQSLAELEILAVDDGSRDGSRTLLEALARQEPRLRVFSSGGGGLVRALNLGLAQARAPLVARMDADDLAHPERLACQAGRFAAGPRVDVLASAVEAGAEAGPGMRRYVAWSNALLTHEQILADLLVESPLVHPSVMAPAALLRELGGYRDFEGPEDYDLWLRAARSGARFAKLDRALLTWNDGPRRLTRCSPRYAPARFLELKLAALESGPLRAPRPVVLWGGGPVAKAWCRALAARGHDVVAFVDVHPRRIGGRLQGRPVLALPEAARLAGALHLAAVGQPGGRQRIRAAAAERGLVEGRDLLAVA